MNNNTKAADRIKAEEKKTKTKSEIKIIAEHMLVAANFSSQSSCFAWHVSMSFLGSDFAIIPSTPLV